MPNTRKPSYVQKFLTKPLVDLSVTLANKLSSVQLSIKNKSFRQQESKNSTQFDDINFSVNWFCEKCLQFMELSTKVCDCGTKQKTLFKRSPRLTTVESLPAPAVMKSPTNYTICSEITSNVEEHDNVEASKVFNKIKKLCLMAKTSFIDGSFPHSYVSIGDLRPSEVDEKKCVPYLKWLRPQYISTDESNEMAWEVFRDPTPDDIKQGHIGDCWLISAMTLISERPDILDKIFITKKYNAKGIYQIRICVDGMWKTVLIDDFLPCDAESKLYFATGKKKQLWVSLLEKAIAKAYGSYGNLVTGSSTEGLEILTGAPCVRHKIENFVIEKNTDLLWAKLLSSKEAGFIQGCSCGNDDLSKDIYETLGLVSYHAYSVLDVRVENGYRLLRLRNPHGSRVWNGAWSDDWKGWDPTMKSKLIDQQISGTFWIGYHDFLQYFNCVQIAKLPRNFNWNELRIPVQFGGVFRELDSAVRIVVESPTEITFTLFQTGIRERKNEEVDIMICVHKVTPDDQIGELSYRSKRDIFYNICTEENLFTSGHYIVFCHSMTTLGGQKKQGTLVIHSTLSIYADVIHSTCDMYTDSLIQMMLIEGQISNPQHGSVTRVIRDKFAGMMIMVDNTTENRWLHVKTFCGESIGVISSRRSLDVCDSIPPLSRKIIIILTYGSNTGSFVTAQRVETKISNMAIDSFTNDIRVSNNDNAIETQYNVRSMFIF